MTARRVRRRDAAELVVIHWRDIPAQVTVTFGGRKQTGLLPVRFQHAIDRAAGVAGLTANDDYVANWRRLATPLASDEHGPDETIDAEQIVAETIGRLDAAYDRDRLEGLVRSGGLDAAS